MADTDAYHAVPRDSALDGALAFLREGYRYIGDRCDRLGTDLFRTRMLMREVVCVRGPEAAALLYDRKSFTRRNAMPSLVLRLLQDEGSVQQLDGNAHHVRKALFLAMMTDAAIARLEEIAEAEWLDAAARWERLDEVVLHDEARHLLCRAVCRWTGVPQTGEDAARRTAEFSAMIDGAGSFGPRNWKGQILRLRAERWARDELARVRAEQRPDNGTAAAMITRHADVDGSALDLDSAAVELLNVLRPTVAVARFVVFVALALFEHPEAATRIGRGDEAYLDGFIQEVRRYYPFFPLVGGRALRPVTCCGYPIVPGEQVFLDLYGTNHHPDIWDEPDRFLPERFIGQPIDPNELVPQGAGDHAEGHRCPGEWITLALMKQAARLLTQAFCYDVPEQDLTVSLSKVPALPASGFRIRNATRFAEYGATLDGRNDGQSPAAIRISSPRP